MANIFDFGNARLNRFVYDILSPQAGDHILEIGFGTGKLIGKIAGQTNDCVAEGIDISDTMVSMARRNNKRHIAAGRVVIFYSKSEVEALLSDTDFSLDAATKPICIGSSVFNCTVAIKDR